MALEGTVTFHGGLTTESIEGAALSFKCVDDIHCCDRLPFGVFGVRDGVTNDILEENFQNTTRLFVNETGNALDTTTASQTANGWFSDALNIITQHFTMTFSAAFSQAFASFTASSHSSIESVSYAADSFSCRNNNV